MSTCEQISLDIGAVPWSRFDSYLTISTLVKGRPDPWESDSSLPLEDGIYIHDVSGSRFWKWNGIFRLFALEQDGSSQFVVASALPDMLVLRSRYGVVETTFDGPDTLRFRGRGVGMRLVQSLSERLGSALAFKRNEHSWFLHMGGDAHYVVTCLSGSLSVDSPTTRTHSENILDRKVLDGRPGPDGTFELALTQLQSGYVDPEQFRSFDECAKDVREDFAAWLASQPSVRPEFAEARDLAAYVTWASVVAPRGLLRRHAMLMSKNWMHAVWSWDHCFNAMGLASPNPDLAWDQLMLLFDVQTAQGALPDIVHDNGWLLGFLKPPVHGWALSKIMALTAISRDRLAEVYPKLVKWTEWWLVYRDEDNDGLCEYFHGCECQDNSSAFDVGFPVIGPDLAAYLVIQMDTLASLARTLGKPEEAARWEDKASAMLACLLAKLWDGNTFHIVRRADCVTNEQSECCIPFIPMILGKRLPPEIRRRLVDTFKASGLLTMQGIASEQPGSQCYVSDGYWRGPVWAPITCLIADGLLACGEPDLALEVASRFARTCRASGFPENFDAVSGKPLRDPAYSWTASVFLYFAGIFGGGGVPWPPV